ncbi:unnamed protein product, partial [Mycena citricolor]
VPKLRDLAIFKSYFSQNRSDFARLLLYAGPLPRSGARFYSIFGPEIQKFSANFYSIPDRPSTEGPRAYPGLFAIVESDRSTCSIRLYCQDWTRAAVSACPFPGPALSHVTSTALYLSPSLAP